MSTSGTGFPTEDLTPPTLEAVQSAFPQLEILELIGQGGMGAVYKARQSKLERLVALKILPQRLALEPQFAERFEREGKLLARLSHPNIVGVHDFGQADGFYYLMMEFVDGVNLRQALVTAQFTPQQALSVIPMICEALQFAHDQGVLHRDIKPENILLDSKGRVKIADFGIAKFAGLDDKTGLTATGATIGTPHYMAPEQIERPSEVDHRADIFSLGVVFYEMLTGELPLGRFAAPSERTQALDGRIDLIVMRALEKDRERRQQSANEVRTQVEHLSHQAQAANVPNNVEPPPVVRTVNRAARYFDRSVIAMTLVVASLVVPLGLMIFLDPPQRAAEFFLLPVTAWLGIPGTVLGASHLAMLAKRGRRDRLLLTIIATTFWPLAIALLIFFFTAMKLLEAIHQRDSLHVEPVEVTLIIAVGLVLTVLSIRSLYRWISGIAPVSDSDQRNRNGNTAMRLLLQIFGGAAWVFIGLAIVFLTPVGTLERLFLALALLGVAGFAMWSIKRWIEGTAPVPPIVPAPIHPVDRAMRNILKASAVMVWLGALVTTIYWLHEAPKPVARVAPPVAITSTIYDEPYLILDIASITSKENVLVIDVTDNYYATRFGQEAMGAEAFGGEFGDSQLPGETSLGGAEGTPADVAKPTLFEIDFRGPQLLPDAVISASENYKEKCFYPGEPGSIKLDLSAGKSGTLAFAFPDARAALACKLRIERQLYAEQWPMSIGLHGEQNLLFQANSAFGEYNIYVKATR